MVVVIGHLGRVDRLQEGPRGRVLPYRLQHNVQRVGQLVRIGGLFEGTGRALGSVLRPPADLAQPRNGLDGNAAQLKEWDVAESDLFTIKLKLIAHPFFEAGQPRMDLLHFLLSLRDQFFDNFLLFPDNRTELRVNQTRV